MDNNVQILVEGVIYAAGKRGVTRDTILEKSNIDPSELELAIYQLKQKYPNDGTSGLVLNDFGELLSISTYSKVGEQVGDILLKDKQKELTGVLLETLAIVAYEQPVTKGEIERIRGVNCDYAINVLQAAKLIYVSGKRNTLGTPREYSTTQEFLLRFQLKNIYELTESAEIQNRLKAITEACEEKSLFKEVPSDFAKLEIDENFIKLDEEDISDVSLSMGAGELEDDLEDDYISNDDLSDVTADEDIEDDYVADEDLSEDVSDEEGEND